MLCCLIICLCISFKDHNGHLFIIVFEWLNRVSSCFFGDCYFNLCRLKLLLDYFVCVTITSEVHNVGFYFYGENVLLHAFIFIG